ncbi:MAG: ATP/GTP-binding protein [Nitrososphaerota archaeon]|nr:ATP/GTP-binding protein [Nitrososphaerota archaeon]MDG6939419.1 ATP/GTP-binding protein [Nitrososphaerota archaeon]
MFGVYVLGTAGCGKSLLTHSLKNWLTSKEWHVITANLDPGAESLPYDPDVDVRLHLDLHELMERYQLGPNGALVLASDMLATKAQEIQDEIDSCNADIVIFDTPGQMELFAYRPSGQFLASNFAADGKAVLFLYDAWLCKTPENFLSLNLLASSVRLRFNLPFISVLNKADIAKEEAKQAMKWASNPRLLEASLGEALKGDDYSLYSSLLRGLVRNGFVHRMIPSSAATMEGMTAIASELFMLFKGGEDSEA